MILLELADDDVLTRLLDEELEDTKDDEWLLD